LERGFTQEELAHRAGVDRTYVSALERMVYAPSVDVLDQIAKAFDVDPWALITPSE
jgi:transcriptional regulator with XRE-family HTH domain